MLLSSDRPDAAGRYCVACAVIVLALGMAACSTGSPRTTDARAVGAHAQIGDLSITGAFVPAPASPDVAAAYFTVANRGSSVDQLIQVTSDVSAVTGLHTYADARMVDLTQLDIPAGSSTRLQVGGVHVMIENPTRSLTAGQTVRLTLTFRVAGAVHVDAPVVATTGPQDTDMSGMDMSGMNMPG